MAIRQTIASIANANQSNFMRAVGIADVKREQNNGHVGEHKSLHATSQVGPPK